MAAIENPALKRFVAELGDELLFAQVLIRRTKGGYELRSATDRDKPPEALRLATTAEARALAQTTATGEFRPLKSAPTLVTGWRLVAASDAELGTALNHLYPGAIADWFAAQSPNPPVTHYRDYAGRQSGMYRITAMLEDASAAKVIQAACARALCLKRRLWTVPGLAPDTAEEKSLIPCLEPCAILMELARQAVRREQAQNLVNP